MSISNRQFISYYVEVSKPPYPAAGFDYRVYRASKYDKDTLSPNLVMLISVKAALSASDALAQALCRAAGVVVITGGNR